MKGTVPFIFAEGTDPFTNMKGTVPFDKRLILATATV